MEYGHHGFGESSAAPLIIDGRAGEVLPRLDRDALCDLLRRLPRDELEMALREKLLKVVSLPGISLHAACGAPALALARARGLSVVGHAEAADFLAAARAVHGAALRRRATFDLLRAWPTFSASRRVTKAQWLVFLLSMCALLCAGALLSLQQFLVMLSAVSGSFFLGVVALRVLCVMPPLARDPPARQRMPSDGELPVYSVLVPLFRETAVLGQIVKALRALDYPQEKLDIKLILEEEDMLMQAALLRLPLPPQIEAIIVPAGRPQTKPRALNYALQFCRGSLITIYDAEDIPETDQLRKAAARFAAAPPELACLQAELTFYNPDDNWLARQFTAEYATLFGEILRTLADHGLPLPLGGTSNHFRTDVLRRVGAWDPFNVTEDADLGLRLARLGYYSGVLDSLTHEEANTRLGNWMRQRSRWLKGFLMTWLVHMREPMLFLREVGPAGFWAAQALTIGVFASVLLHPLCLVATVALWMIFPMLPQGAGPAFVLLTGMNLLVLVAGYGIAILLTGRALARRGIKGSAVTLATMPFYWMLMSAAAWAALWQFVVRPFHWNKTEHGLARKGTIRQRRGTGPARRRSSRRNGRQAA